MDTHSEPEDDIYEYTDSNSLSCRRDLYIARTRLQNAKGERYHFWGLFCHNLIKKGEFIGLYTGTWVHESDETRNAYGLILSIGAVVTPPIRETNGVVSVSRPELYPAALANEPKRDDHANAFLHEWVLDRSEVSGIPRQIQDERFFCAGLVACTDIPGNTEIRWYYGDSYQKHRNYNAGKPCVDANVIQQHPIDGLRQFGVQTVPFESVTPFISTPDNSSDDSEDNDPSYRGRLLQTLLSFR